MIAVRLPSPAAPRAPAAASRLPRRWCERLPLLECQHDRLEALLDRLVDAHRAGGALPAAADLASGRPDDGLPGCHALLRLLGLHLRLEERWLMAYALAAAAD